MSTKDIILHRSLGEAHLYIAVIKADEVISKKEEARIKAYAGNTKSLLDILNIDKEVKENLLISIENILSDASFSSWDSYKHLEEGLSNLKKAKDLGDIEVAHLYSQCEDAFYKLARLNGYLLKESRLLDKIKEGIKTL